MKRKTLTEMTVSGWVSTTLSAILVTALFGTACATESRVREHRASQEVAIDRLQRQAEETRGRLTRSTRLLVDLSNRLDTVHETVEDTLFVSQEARRAAADLDRPALISRTLFTDESIRFASGSTELSADSRLRLDLFAAELLARGGDFFVEIHGHADRTGNEIFNRALAFARAERVQRYLHERNGVPLARMHILSLGSEDPLETAPSVDSLARNRRVTLVVRH